MSKKEKVIDRLMDLQESYDKEYIKMRELICNTKTKKMSKKEFYFLMGFFTAGTLALIAFGLSTIF
tara:strand:- start:208 stop:405 length:198 start_codon:yes stop_codon:yes gene_type:complete